jgi:hypothetical protein
MRARILICFDRKPGSGSDGKIEEGALVSKVIDWNLPVPHEGDEFYFGANGTNIRTLNQTLAFENASDDRPLDDVFDEIENRDQAASYENMCYEFIEGEIVVEFQFKLQ